MALRWLSRCCEVKILGGIKSQVEAVLSSTQHSGDAQAVAHRQLLQVALLIILIMARCQGNTIVADLSHAGLIMSMQATKILLQLIEVLATKAGTKWCLGSRPLALGR